MRYLIFFFLFSLFSFELHAQKIATFKFSLILDNLNAYKNFTNDLDNFKKKKFDELKSEEILLLEQKNEIEESKLLFSEEEYLNKVTEYNLIKEKFENKIKKLNNYLQKNIDNNEKIIMFQIIEILKQIAQENGIDIIFSDEQYFLSSDSIDVSEQIYNNINKLNLDLKLSEYE